MKVFQNYKENLDELNDPKYKSSLSTSDGNEISKMQQECCEKLDSYHSSNKNDKSGKSKDAKNNLTKKQEKALKGMEQFINTQATRLNSIFKAAGLPQVLCRCTKQ